MYYKKKKTGGNTNYLGKYQNYTRIKVIVTFRQTRQLGAHTHTHKKKTIQDLYGLHIIIYYYLAVNTIPWFHS